MRFQMVILCCVAFESIGSMSCGGPTTLLSEDESSSEWGMSYSGAIGSLGESKSEASEVLPCTEVEAGLWACPSESSLLQWGHEHHVMEPDESSLAAPLDPPDPLEIRDGIELYDELLELSFRTRAHIDLWENTPTLSETEVAYFSSHQDVWEAVVAFRAASPGEPRLTSLQQALDSYEAPSDARRIVLRDGVFYFEDSRTARWAADNLSLRDLFDEERIVLERAGERFDLERGRGGHYYYADPELDDYRARLFLFDRVGLPDELASTASYQLSVLREHLGLDHVAVDAEDANGRPVRAAFLSGETFNGRLARVDHGEVSIGIIADAEMLVSVLEQSRAHATVIYGLRDVTFEMVREDLFFDEPTIEFGQQDGIMRLAFMEAYEQGESEYTVNKVTYDVYDDEGRPRPPQVCIDYITDTVERYAGRWWPDANTGATSRTEGLINIRDYMTYRQVRRLVSLAEEHPEVASAVSFDSSDLVSYEDSDAFFDNLWTNRDDFRIADVVVIYGLRNDGRNHYHSFYVYDTDPMYGMPITLTDQAGHARIRTWHRIMSDAPLRSIHHRVRWNPDWVLNPTEVIENTSIEI